jgi:hypothetical protein
MIQRIQTIYLLIALAFLASCCFVPIAAMAPVNGQILVVNLFRLTPGKAETLFHIALVILAGFIVVIDLAIIFSYKKRKKQMNMCMISIILLICLNLLLFYQLWHLKKMGIIESYQVTSVFPLLSAVLTYLAYRGIKKDENLVRSYERLR